jgi:hypothetical protein
MFVRNMHSRWEKRGLRTREECNFETLPFFPELKHRRAMKKKIDDPTRPEGFYYGYETAEDCLADFESEMKNSHGSDVEAAAGYTCLWVFLAALVTLSILAGLFHW